MRPTPPLRLAAIALVWAGCGWGAGCSENPVTTEDGGETPATVQPFREGIRIGWDTRTRRRLFDGPASYPRMIRLLNGDLLCSVESAGSSYVLRSEDDGASWSAPILAAAAEGSVIAAVPSLLQRPDGRVLLAYNTRPPADNQNPDRRFGIKIVASDDGGRTWEPWADVVEGGYTWGEGVWEPSMLHLASGELLLYFANEARYPSNDDQEISLVRSVDGGRTWSSPETVSYREGHRDGMPVPLLLQNGEALVVAIEDDGVVPGPFKPALLRLPPDGATGSVIRGDSPLRTPALADGARLAVSAYGGAPYLAQLPGGETLLSFQSNAGRGGDWARSTLTVALGDEDGRSFDRLSQPFLVPEGRHALWNSLFVKDANTVTALSATNAFNPDHAELYVVDGHRIPEPVAYRGSVEVDGDVTEDVWGQATSVFVGAYGERAVWGRTAWDDDALYVALDVQDVGGAGTPSADADVLVALAPRLLAEDRPVENAFHLHVGVGGAVQLFEGQGGQWAPTTAEGVTAEASWVQVRTVGRQREGRTVVEVAVPWDRLGGRPAVGAAWGLTLGVVDRDQQGNKTREWVAGTEGDRPSTWLKTTLAE